MDISELEIPEVPIPARILEEKARALKNQRAVLASAKARRKKSTTAKAGKSVKNIKRQAS
jgi:hypothetical protein